MNDHAILARAVSAVEPPAGNIEMVADAAERTALAAAYDLVAVKGLSASVTVTGEARGAITVDGRVVADIVQTCVISLVPVDQHIDETVSVDFVRRAAPPPRPGAEIVVDPEAPDPPEVLDGPTVDVGALVEEYFALAIDPYPHAPGAKLPPELAQDPDDSEDSPFAALADLVKPPKRKT